MYICTVCESLRLRRVMITNNKGDTGENGTLQKQHRDNTDHIQCVGFVFLFMGEKTLLWYIKRRLKIIIIYVSEKKKQTITEWDSNSVLYKSIHSFIHSVDYIKCGSLRLTQLYQLSSTLSIYS